MAQNDLIVSVLSSPCSSYCVEGVVCSVPVTFVIDTGAAVSLINNCVWNQIARPAKNSYLDLIRFYKNVIRFKVVLRSYKIL